MAQLCYRGTYDTVHKYCQCDPLWAGEACDIFMCMHGAVTQVGVDHDGSPMLACQCLPGWTGSEYVMLDMHTCVVRVVTCVSQL